MDHFFERKQSKDLQIVLQLVLFLYMYIVTCTTAYLKVKVIGVTVPISDYTIHRADLQSYCSSIKTILHIALTTGVTVPVYKLYCTVLTHGVIIPVYRLYCTPR